MGNVVATIIDLANAHHSLAYGLVVALAASEALPILGLFIPATAIIVGLSALVPTGAIDLWPLIAGASIGAIIGDGASYWLGHRYHREITERWPLRHYPALITRGEEFFRRHGGASVFIARFTPGVRSVVPLIAGILRMPTMRFYSMNVLSAALWAPSHVLAGALIGASLQLLGAVAGRLAVLLVVLIFLLWLVAWVMRRALRRLPAGLAYAHGALSSWTRTRDNWISRQIQSLLDPGRREVQGLAVLGGLLIVGVWSFFAVLEDIVSGDPLVRVDTAVFHLLQSLRTVWADQVMVAVTELGGGVVTGAVSVAALIWLAWRKDWHTAAYWVAAVGGAGLFTLLLKVTLHHPRPSELYSGWDAYSFPSGHTTVNATLYAVLAILVSREVAARWRPPVVVGAALLVSAIAFSRLYLGAHWISDVLAGLAFGIAWAALLGIAYLRRDRQPVGGAGLGVVAVIALVAIGGIDIVQNHAADMTRYALREERRAMRVSDWWQQGWATLPARRFDLGGELEEPLTVQWAGDLRALKTALLANGWQVPIPWGLQSSLAWLTARATVDQLPVLARLQDGSLEGLVMVRLVDDSDQRSRLVLHLWRANIDLRDDSGLAGPIWIGTVAVERTASILSIVTLAREQAEMNTPRDIFAEAVSMRRRDCRANVRAVATWDGCVVLARSPTLSSWGG